jgi:hypothetical protein
MPGLRSAASLGLLCTTLWAGTGFAHGTPVSDALLLIGPGQAFDLSIDFDVHALASPGQEPHDAWRALRQRLAEGDAARERVRRDLTGYLDPRVTLKCDAGEVSMTFDLPNLDAPYLRSGTADALDASGRAPRIRAEAQGALPARARQCVLMVDEALGEVLLRIRRPPEPGDDGKRPPDETRLLTPAVPPASFAAPEDGKARAARIAEETTAAEAEDSAGDAEGSGGPVKKRPVDETFVRFMFFAAITLTVALTLYFSLRERPKDKKKRR